jgi:ABC-2 type transport system ATP-binding protein
MALTADHVIVIGLGKLIRDESVSSFINSSSRGSVLVRSPAHARLSALLVDAGADVSPAEVRDGGGGDDGADRLEVVGLDAAQIGEIAAASGVVLHELTPQRASLEEAFMELTQDSVEFHASGKVA